MGRRPVLLPLAIGLFLGLPISRGFAADTYKLAFDYEPAPLYVDSLSKLLDLTQSQAKHFKGSFAVRADGDLFYSELRVDQDLKVQEWRYPNSVVRYNLSLKELQVFKPEWATSDIVPIWLPASYQSRKFVRDSSECEPGTGLCIEYPGHTDRVLRLPETRTGNAHTLALPGREKEFLVSWEQDGKKLKQVSVRDSFKTQSAGSSSFDQTQQSQISYVGMPAANLQPGNWEELAKGASSITVDGIGIVYDPKKGSLWDQRVASIRAWKGAGVKKAAEVGVPKWIYSAAGLGIFMLLVGSAKVVLTLLRKK